MARKKIISDEIREEVIARVQVFNEENALPPLEPGPISTVLTMLGLKRPTPTDPQMREGAYVPKFRGAYLYLDRIGFNGRPFEVCRLKWTGDINQWDFAIYRHSRNFYDPDEWFFPGAEEVDGTVEGAMRAGMEAYPL